MRIKKFKAESMPVALEQIKAALGDEAVILQVNKVSGNDGQSDMIEVTAALDQQPLKRNTNKDQKKGTNRNINTNTASSDETAYPWAKPDSAKSRSIDALPNFYQRPHDASGARVSSNDRGSDKTPKPLKTARKKPGSRILNAHGVSGKKQNHCVEHSSEIENKRVNSKLDAKRVHITNQLLKPADPAKPVKTEKRHLDIQTDKLSEMRERFNQRPTSRHASTDETYDDLSGQLVGCGVDPELTNQIVDEVSAMGREAGRHDGDFIEQSVIRVIADRITCAPPTGIYVGRPTVVALVGPTGVGKTTTLAKLAVNAQLRGNWNVSLISADTYRVGAIHQLRTFAHIAEIPLTVVYNPDEMHQAICEVENTDLIFIDTVGRSQNMSEHVEELSHFIDAANPDEVCLVASATSKDSDICHAIDQFGIMPINRLLMTKLDETITFGSLINVLDKTSLPLSYVTTGQTVPDDIEEPRPEWLAQQIIQGGMHVQPGIQVA